MGAASQCQESNLQKVGMGGDVNISRNTSSMYISDTTHKIKIMSTILDLLTLAGLKINARWALLQ